jgi:hypothetical protein
MESLRIAPVIPGPRHGTIECRIVCRAAHFAEYRIVAQVSGCAGERIELVALWLRREQQQKHDIDWPAIDGIEVDRLGEANQDPEWPRHSLKARVGNGNSRTRSGRAERFTFQQRLRKDCFVQPEDDGGPMGEFMQQVRLVDSAHSDPGLQRAEEVLDFHDPPNAHRRRRP